VSTGAESSQGCVWTGAASSIRKQYARDASGHIFGRPTYWLRGGWRCTNGAGSASCWNAADERYNTITIADVEQRFAIVATVEFVEELGVGARDQFRRAPSRGRCREGNGLDALPLRRIMG